MNACLDCGRSCIGSRCPTHQAAADARRNAKAAAHGLHRGHWQNLRRQRLELAGGRCELALDEFCTVAATTVHLNPALEGNHDAAAIDDVRAACAHCHGVADAPRARQTVIA